MQFKTTLFISSLFISLLLQAQTSAYKHPSILDVHFFLSDLNSKASQRNVNNYAPGIGISYVKGINKRIDWSARLNGSFPDSALKYNYQEKGKTLLLSTDVFFRARMFPKASLLQPYALLGIGTSLYRKKFDMFFPMGAGFEINYKDIYFNVSTEYRKSLIQQFNSHFFYSLGIAGVLGKGKKKKFASVTAQASVTYTLRDKDGDGIVDTADACADHPGLAVFQGCPDSDGDQIADKEDKCPTVFGFQKYGGCPIPDKDGDGINDEEDLCITIPGFARYQGCPLVKKELTEHMKKAAQNIFFESGSYRLLSRSFTALNEVATILKNNPELKLTIEGHTDSQGTEISNQTLSTNRATEVSLYLEKKGVQQYRLNAIGHGQSRPIADNSSKEGRSKNRRVELILLYQ